MLFVLHLVLHLVMVKVVWVLVPPNFSPRKLIVQLVVIILFHLRVVIIHIWAIPKDIYPLFNYSVAVLLQLQMRISFPFLLAKELRRFYWSREIVFLSLLYVGGTYSRLVYTWYKNNFPHDCSTDNLSCREWKKGIWWKQYQNDTATKQRRDSVTVSDAIASKIDTQKNKNGTGHRQDRDKREKTVTTAHNGSAC